ncbi:hypothetical protein [Enterococcus sp. BWR-S5]|uniref:hypothetical protein n=1 Tax=Enterococcus sp. BWR-S5 TaxID=2787714 RepID=UPI0019245454|nr:hypothetical protein [Enterococcus sp. BWR-S5]MBL1223827.1 hypothetical protein [Enterococcus sp. BWR-S5]
MYKLVEDKLEKENLIRQYFVLIGDYIEDFMFRFLNNESFRIDAMAILFKEDLDEEDDEEELQEIKDNQVLLVSEYPASPQDEKAYYSYEEIGDHIETCLNENYKENIKFQEIFKELKAKLES